MRVIYAMLAGIRARIPFLVAVIFMTGAAIIGLQSDVDIRVFSISGAAVGYIIGIFVRNAVPDTTEKAFGNDKHV